MPKGVNQPFKIILIAATCLTGALQGLATPSLSPAPLPYGSVPSARQLRWHEIEAYFLIHFSMATFSDKEWGFGDQPATDFNPSDFSAGQIVEAAKAADLKGLILVAKHHDGFCLWPTDSTPYSVKNAPWKEGKGDIVKEFADAVRKQGLHFGLYCSPWDRNHPEYARPAYVEVFHRQLKELWTRYGELFEVWFDGAFGGSGYYGGARESRKMDPATYYRYTEIFKFLRKLQPNALVFSAWGPDIRWCGNERGFVNPICWPTYTLKDLETGKPVPIDPKSGLHTRFPTRDIDRASLPRGDRSGISWIPAECDFPLRPGWFYHAHQDNHLRSPQNLVETYYITVGRGASFNIGLAPDKRGRLHDNDVAVLKKFGEWKRETFRVNLAAGARATASNTRGNAPTFAPDNVLDGKPDTYWATDDAVKTPELVLDLGKPTPFNVVSLREYLPLGQRIDDWALDSWQDGQWVEFAKGTSIGSRRLVRAPEITTTRVRLRITRAAASTALREFALHREPLWSRLGAKGIVQESGMSKKGWKIHSFSYQALPGGGAERTIDNNPRTLWNTYGKDGERGVPQYVAVDMGREVTLSAFLCLPRSDSVRHSLVDRYRYEVSLDGKTWTPVAEGEFSNIRNNPVLQTVPLKKPVKARYFRFTALHAIGSIHVSVAELGVIGKAN